MDELPAVGSHAWRSFDHHDADGGFRNVWEPRRGGSVWKGMKWFLGSALRSKENRPPASCKIDPTRFASPPERLRVTWIGHSTTLLQSGSVSILIDPIFSDRASPFSHLGPARKVDLPIRLDDLPRIDVVVLSHDHYDHLDRASIEHLADVHEPLFLTPLGVASYVRRWGGRHVVEMDWWQYADHGRLRYHCVPAKHFSGRGLHNRDGTLWAGWYIDGLGPDVLYAGDSGYAEHFQQIRERIGRPEIAILPIGAYLPSWLMQPVHVSPDEALQAFLDLEADYFIPVHWGTFDLADEALHEPAERLSRLARERGISPAVQLMEIGSSWVLPGDHPFLDGA